MRLFKKLIRKIAYRFRPSQRGSGPIVRAICITVVKNEQDIIEPFLRSNRPFFDAMIVLDNRSSDRTRAIAMCCARELGGIFVTDTPSFANTQSKTITDALKHAQSAFFADFVCFLDADEFVGAADREAMLMGLDDVPVGAISQHQWLTYLPDPQAPFGPTIDPLSRMTYRRRQETPPTHKVFLRMGGGFDPDIEIPRGAHKAVSGLSKRLPMVQRPALAIKHFPVRNPDQIIAKGLLGWSGNLAQDPSVANAPVGPRTTSYQWKRIYTLVQESAANLDLAHLSDEAMIYSQTSAPTSFIDNAEPCDNGLDLTRAYSDGHSVDHQTIVAASLLKSGKAPPVYQAPLSRHLGAGQPDAVAAGNGVQPPHTCLDAAPFCAFVERHQPDSALHLRCGEGLYLGLLKTLGVTDILGLGSLEHAATVLDDADYLKADADVPFNAGRQFHTVVCLDVVPRGYPQAIDRLFDTIAAHANRTIIFSMAEPEQVRQQRRGRSTMPDVLAMWRKRGWVPDLIETLGFRALSTCPALRRNVVILKPASDADDGATKALCKIASLTYKWYVVPPGIHHYAFAAPYPALHQAYSIVRG